MLHIPNIRGARLNKNSQATKVRTEHTFYSWIIKKKNNQCFGRPMASKSFLHVCSIHGFLSVFGANEKDCMCRCTVCTVCIVIISLFMLCAVDHFTHWNYWRAKVLALLHRPHPSQPCERTPTFLWNDLWKNFNWNFELFRVLAVAVSACVCCSDCASWLMNKINSGVARGVRYLFFFLFFFGYANKCQKCQIKFQFYPCYRNHLFRLPYFDICLHTINGCACDGRLLWNKSNR